MKLSFVIPAYNEELYIGKCLDSISAELKGKSYNTEIIVVNNASTDRTGEVAASFPNVKVVYEPNKGIVWARHAGLAAATGELIANIDADTMLTKGWVDRVMKEFSHNPKLVALSGPFIYYDSPRNLQRATRFFYHIGFVGYLVNRFILKIGSMLQGGNFIVRREALEKAGGFDTSINFYGEDTDIARRLHPLGDVKWTYALPMYASGRRLMKEGAFTIGLRYAINHFWILYFKKPFSEKYTDIRVAEDLLTYKPANIKREAGIIAAVVLLLLIILGTTGLIATAVYAKQSPRQVALRMYHNVYYKLNDNDSDWTAFKAHFSNLGRKLVKKPATITP